VVAATQTGPSLVNSRTGRGASGGATAEAGASGGLPRPAEFPSIVDTVLDAYRKQRELRAEIKALRRKLRSMEESRDHWRREALSWKWGALHKGRD